MKRVIYPIDPVSEGSGRLGPILLVDFDFFLTSQVSVFALPVIAENEQSEHKGKQSKVEHIILSFPL